ncbi:28S ribosomal protein S28, mitochondrial [Frankliniella fusca]|uniref:28S ribosomal protein S28, mitochondrial n=1 Tax=Frankliniella fusca TaxID=407009 RepID=A0AAE1L9Q6_9NEOP|nr:28S ribosomal protein S28, mitochondrial [Frankliniella fusca]
MESRGGLDTNFQSSICPLLSHKTTFLFQLGDPKGKTVVGRIYRVVDDDLYVDFDWKFPCVVKRPTLDAHLYVNNAEVRLRILDLEMSTIFLGAEKETSLNEANCVLVGLINSPLGVPKSKEDFSSGFN